MVINNIAIETASRTFQGQSLLSTLVHVTQYD